VPGRSHHAQVFGSDRRPWLIISKREAEAILVVIKEYTSTLWNMPGYGAQEQDLKRAERVIANQLVYIEGGLGEEPSVMTTLMREHGLKP